MQGFNKDTEDKNRLFKANENKGWTPGKNHHAINNIVEAVEKGIECTETSKSKQPHPNLDKGEKEAVKKLSKREYIIITNADKDSTNYIKEAELQLNDKDNCHILP